MKRNFYFKLLLPILFIIAILFFTFVPVVSETQIVHANWGTLSNNTGNPSTFSNGAVCPGYSECKNIPNEVFIPSIVSVTYYLWRLGGEMLEGNMSVYANGTLMQATPITGASSYIVVFGQTCATGFVCLENSSMTVSKISNATSTRTA